MIELTQGVNDDGYWLDHPLRCSPMTIQTRVYSVIDTISMQMTYYVRPCIDPYEEAKCVARELST